MELSSERILYMDDHLLQGRVLEILRNYACPHCGNYLLENGNTGREDSLSKHSDSKQTSVESSQVINAVRADQGPLSASRGESAIQPPQKYWGVPHNNRWLNAKLKTISKPKPPRAPHSLVTKPQEPTLKVIEAKFTTTRGAQHFTVTSTKTLRLSQLRTPI